ncbi:EAL domain-containing protein [Acidovorax sp.]|uniref:bifunctional diguanylate cyclase/phosphodiesterase n=1 Tax=Acidovorax sp. TaxID=1872122 RepID=UPI00391C685B
MQSGQVSAWILRGTYPRLYLPIVLIILAVTTVRYHYLLDAEIDTARRHAATELQRASNALLPVLAALPSPPDVADASNVLRAGGTALGPHVRALAWHVAESPGAEVTLTPPDTRAAPPAWFTRWVDMAPPVQQFVHTPPTGPMARLTVTLHPEPFVQEVWSTVSVQARITALNIFTILFLLTLLLRANARMLQRLAAATNAFRQGHLSTRMQETGTLESRAMAATFNDMAGKVQSLVLSLRETQQMQSEQLHFTRQLIDSLPLPVFVRDMDGRCRDANRAWRQLFPPSTTGDSGSAAGQACPPELSPECCSQIAQSQDNEICVQRNHRPPLYMAYYEASFTSINGVQAGTIGTLVDVTERKRAEEALRAEKERAEVTLACIGDGVITTNLTGHIDSINEAAQLMTGFTAQQAIGRPLSAVFRLYEEAAAAPASDSTLEHPTGGPLRQATYEVLIHRSGEHYAIEYTASPIRKSDGMTVGCVLVFRDVTETRNLRHQISWHARHDPLTGLYNRAALAERLTHAIFVARDKGLLLAVCMLDLDHFQNVNDTYGNRVGDRLLKETARRLGAFASAQDAVARMGGDEFVLLLGELPDVAAIRARVAVLMQQLAAPYAIDDRLLHTTVSIGIAVFPQDDANPDTLLRHADQAMCQAKSFGRNQMHVFDVQHDHAVQTQHSRQTRIAQSLRDGELVLHYQPKVNLRTGEVLGLEALLRWQHPEEGLLGPQHILPLIEDIDLQVELGEWVLQQALDQLRLWTRAGMQWEVSVNIAAPHFHRPSFVQRLKDILQTCPEIAPERLELEILESAALDDMQYMRRMMQSCQALGVRFALDDFGTGYSSLSYLKRLPAETIKIDQSFVRGILEDDDDLTLVSAIVALAAAFHRRVVAEGVETAEQCARLLTLGCEHAQGFGIARPMPAQEVTMWAQSYATQVAPHADALGTAMPASSRTSQSTTD